MLPVEDKCLPSLTCFSKLLIPTRGNTLLQMQIVINNIINKILRLLINITINIGLFNVENRKR
ncbi:MAG TPA: hypothetical protein DIW62_13150 [Raoultella sp.]|nr:hypothetical protein [Raoultella sp.]